MNSANKERLSLYMMRAGAALMKRPGLIRAVEKSLARQDALKSQIDSSLNAAARALCLAVQEDMEKTNHAVRGLKHHNNDLAKTVGDLQSRLKKSGARLKKMEG